ncbi:hypothetical protein [Aquimarina litoralis]|uniref:hypothetical protein n=1 Tax=Aquimarina litoralis TaxID=584605 RepID=UPI001C559DEC|nr:hypothetical protein [Aquimarina litoralis]MBW1298461.1 hypothetical protein [Aquimarina litoralis]
MLQFFIGIAQSEEDMINDIRKKHELVKQWLEKGMRNPTIEIYEQCHDDEEGNEDVSTSLIKYYYQGKELRYITHEHEPYASSAILTQYYFWDNELFFCFQSGHDRYTSYKSNDIQNVIKVFDKRIYFSDRTAFRCLIKEYKESIKEEDGGPSKHPFDQLDSLPNQKVACNTILREINSVEYYLELLKLSRMQLKEKCMSRNAFD